MAKPKMQGVNLLVKFIPEETIEIINNISKLSGKTVTYVIRAILNDQAPKVLKKLNKQGE